MYSRESYIFEGRGGFGKVYKGFDCTTGGIVAIKLIPLEKRNLKEQLETVNNEVKLLEILDHKNIVKYVGHCQDKGYMCIYLEYVRIYVHDGGLYIYHRVMRKNAQLSICCLYDMWQHRQDSHLFSLHTVDINTLTILTTANVHIVSRTHTNN